MSAGGLNPRELADAIAELVTDCGGARVDGVAMLEERDDLLLFLDLGEGRCALQIAPGGQRARVCTTRRRFGKSAFARGPRTHRLEQLLVEARLSDAWSLSGERCCSLRFIPPDGGELTLHCELFGNRGLWALCDAEDQILMLSRLPRIKGRELAPGERYQPPTPPTTAGDWPNRFGSPSLAAIDAEFTALDQAEERDAERNLLRRAIERRFKRAAHKRAGLERQLESMGRADQLQLHADLLLAYGSRLAADAESLIAPDPDDPSKSIEIPRDQRVPPHAQAQALYKKARKQRDGIEICRRQVEEARRAESELQPFMTRIEDAGEDQLPALRRDLEKAGLVEPVRPKPPDQQTRKILKQTAGENFRRFYSGEGHLILVGRDNRQNDKLSTRVARGNDLWLHVGRGWAGSHVVVRLPKGKTASLETLLDAGTLAIYYSKVRGAEVEEVIYTQAKHVRKPKGLPPGRVVPAQTRGLRVRQDPDRLARLMASTDSPPNS